MKHIFSVHRLTGLWRDPDFLKLWAGQTVSVFGVLMGALQFTAVLALDAQPFQMGVLAASRVAPALLFGLLAGAWIDRARRRSVLITADLGRGLLMGSIPVAYFLGLLRIEQLYVVAFGIGTLTIFFDVAYRSYLPSLVGRGHLIEANSKLSASAAVVESTAFSAGGWIVQLLSAITATVINTSTFLFSGVLLALIRSVEPAPAQSSQRRSVAREVSEGLGVVWQSPVLRALMGSVAARGMAHGIIGATILLFVLREIGIQPGIFGVIAAAGGVSSFLGAIVAQRVTRRFGVGPAITVGMVLAGIAAFFIPLAHGPILLAAAFLLTQQVLGDGAETVYEINHYSLQQTITPDSLLGRVNASNEFLGLAATMLASLLAGAMAEIIGLRLTLVAGAFFVLLAGVWLALSPVRMIKGTPPAPVASSPVTD